MPEDDGDKAGFQGRVEAPATTAMRKISEEERDAARALYDALTASAAGEPFLGDFKPERPVTVDGAFDLVAAAKSLALVRR
jgi:hypothetical protein